LSGLHRDTPGPPGQGKILSQLLLRFAAGVEKKRNYPHVRAYSRHFQMSGLGSSSMGDVHLLVASTVLTWMMLVAAALVRTRFWSPSGLKVAFGNRDHGDVGSPSPFASRADRVAKNMLENLVLFGCVILAARLANAPHDRVVLGAAVFFCARVAYVPIYLAGITHLRTLVWAVSIVGLGIIAVAAL